MTRTDPPLTVREADSAAVDRIAALLAANDLPREGLRAGPGRFFAGYADGDVVAGGGLERHGESALLRSAVVAEPYRSRGYGSALCEALGARAVDGGVDALYLLTTTAEAFFRRRGFAVTARDDVPRTIRETMQFAEQCPDTATCMRKALDTRE